jgi:hypothetical protein
MANSTQEAIRIAAEGIAKLKVEMTSLNAVILDGATKLNSMLSADTTSFKELSALLKQVEKSTVKLNEASTKNMVVNGKIKVQESALAKFQLMKNKQHEKEIKLRERQVERISQLDQALRRLKAAEDKVASKAMTGRMVESVNAIGKTNDELKKMSQYYQALEKNQIKQANAIAKENAERIKLANSIASNKKALQSQKEKELNDINKANKARLSEADAIERNKKALDRQKQSMIEASRPFNELIAKHKLSKSVLQDLIVSQGRNSSETKKAQKEYDRLTQKVNQANLATKNFSVSGLNSMAAGFKNLLGAFGIIGGIQIFARAIRDTFNRVREFDKSMQNLSGVFRTNREALKPLEKTIIDVAGASIKTSTEVANLAETLATLGKSPEQIQKLLKPVVDLGIGLNASGAEAGEFLIQMLNAFGASDDEAMKYADTIATIRTSTTLDFQKMRDSFQYIAPISRLLGKDLAYTGSVVGILADNGLKAQQAGRVLGTSLQKLAIKGFTLTEALEQINQAQREGVKETELLAMANSLLGAEGAKIGIVLARNSEIIEKNAQAIRDNGGALDDLVNEQLKSTDAKLLILNATWEELILTIESGEGKLSTLFDGFIETITFAIKQTTELEKAQSDLFKIGVEESGWRKLFNTIIPGLGLISSGYEDAEKAQLRFNKQNKGIENSSLSILESMYKDLDNTMISNNKLSEKEIETYKNQLSVIQKVITVKKEERSVLEKTATELGYQGEAYTSTGEISGKFYKNSTEASSKELAFFIESNKIKNKIIEDQNKKLKGDTESRKKVEGLDLPNTIGIDEKTFEFLGKTREEVESILLIEQFRLEQLNGTGMAYVRQAEYIDSIKNILEDIPDNKLILSPENNEEAQKLIDKLAELENLKDIFSEVTETFADMFDIDISKFDFLFDKIGNTVEDWASLSKELIGSVLDASLQSYEIELQAAQVARDTTLNNDLATEEQKEAARNQFREKERDINTRKAKQERQNNLIKIAVDTAVGIVQALPNIPLSIAVAGIGLAQAALVASQPLPKFEKGTDNAPKGMATTDEKGAEIHTDRLGNIKDLGSNQGARNKYLEKGDKIFTADQSKNMLEGFDANHLQRVIFDMNMVSNGNILSDKAVDRSLLDRMDKLASSNEKVWGEVKKLASRKINVNNKVEIKQDRAY